MSATELESLIELLTSRPMPEDASVDFMRERFDKLRNLLPMPDDAEVDTIDANGVAAERVRAPGTGQGRILYFHGGGYVIGSAATHRRLAYDLSAASGAEVLSLDYRLAPEHPFPAAVDDAVAGYEFLLAEGAAPGDVAVGGDSAGGGLVVAFLVAVKQRGLPMPAAGLAISPWVDMEALGESIESRAEADPTVVKSRLLQMADLYLAGADPRSPLAAPLYADLSGLPPLLIQVGDAEILLSDSTRLAEAARAAGVDVRLEVSDRMIHVWHLYAPLLSEGGEAIDVAGAFIAERLGLQRAA